MENEKIIIPNGTIYNIKYIIFKESEETLNITTTENETITYNLNNINSVTYSESNIIIRCVERNDNVNSIKLQFDNRETYINSALTIISCIRDAHKEIDIMGSCIVY